MVEGARVRPEARTVLLDLVDAVEMCRSHGARRDRWLARAEGALVAYRSVGSMSADEVETWRERLHAAAGLERPA